MSEDSPKYMFPELPFWARCGTVQSPIETGINIHRKDRWIIPDYQRPLVWTQEQKIKFIESVVQGYPIGEYTLHKMEDFSYEVLDGQQRWNAIMCYLNNEFPVFGYKWDELNDYTKQKFEDVPFSHRRLENLTYEQRVQAYEAMAYGGTPHEPKSST